MEKLESGMGIASFLLSMNMLIRFIRMGNLTKTDAIQIVNVARQNISQPTDVFAGADVLKDAADALDLAEKMVLSLIHDPSLQ